MNQLQKPYKILLLGDSCYDCYYYGEVNRISPEAPIPIFDYKYKVTKNGMASNVFSNFKALGIDPIFYTAFFENKNRYIDIKSKNQLLRVDEKLESLYNKVDYYSLLDFSSYDAIVISDYDKGFISYEDIRLITTSYVGPIFIDTKKKDLEAIKNCIFKINQHEYRSLTSYPPSSNLIVTGGSDFVSWNEKKYYPPKVEAHDVCGAGDTFLAALVYEYLNTQNLDMAIVFAINASAITVQKTGVYAPTIREIFA
jgi:bifunctional ADP-heptose synthase (sugar kinase/adenylyltransferase)